MASKPIQITSLAPEMRTAQPTPEAAFHLKPIEQAHNAETTHAASLELTPRASIPKSENEVFKRKQQAVRAKSIQPVPLERETRAALPTSEAAFHLNRAQQTLRLWAMRDGSGAIRPLRINGRLAWPVAELRRVLGVAA